MSPMSREQAHWEAVYTAKDSTAVSWYEDDPSLSLRLIGETGVPLDGAILDVGGGASKLGAQLFGQGYTDITVADISGAALEEARTAVADGAVAWVEADVREHAFGRSFDLWHDRAVFHFMAPPCRSNRYA